MPQHFTRTPVTRHRLSALTSAALALLAIASTSRAMEIDTGNPDVVLRWDNTVRYNLGYRTQDQSKAILGNPNNDDGDRNFGNGALIASRLDLLSEFDMVVDKKYGFRVSGDAWADGAYNSLDNHNNATANTLSYGLPTAGILSPYTSRYAKGPSGELLDAFVFGSRDFGDTNVGLRLGKTTVYWGESLLGGGAIHGISYGQYSLDLWKALATPGIEAKELYRPRTQMTLQVQPAPDLALSAQTFFDWEAARYPESGSYLTVNDALLYGGQSLITGPGQRLLQATAGEPNKNGDFGLSARWSPDWLDGTAGLYGRRTADIQPQLALTPAVAAVPAAACARAGATAIGPTTCYINPGAATLQQIRAGYLGQYQAFYGRDIDIYGLSLAKNIAGLSFGAELSYRHNMPLQSTPVQVLPAGLANPALGQITPAQLANGGAPGAVGNTMHGVFNLIGSVSRTPLWDSATWMAEVTWNRWLSVAQNPNVFKGSAAYRAVAANVDAVTRDYFGLAINFTPTWFQVYPGVDLSLPLSWGGGLSGISAVTTGGAKNNGSYSLGVAADVRNKYNFALRYVGFYGNYSTTAAGAMNVAESVNALLSDRGHVLLTFKTTF